MSLETTAIKGDEQVYPICWVLLYIGKRFWPQFWPEPGVRIRQRLFSALTSRDLVGLEAVSLYRSRDLLSIGMRAQPLARVALRPGDHLEIYHERTAGADAGGSIQMDVEPIATIVRVRGDRGTYELAASLPGKMPFLATRWIDDGEPDHANMTLLGAEVH